MNAHRLSYTRTLIGSICLSLLATACGDEDSTEVDTNAGSAGQTGNNGGSSGSNQGGNGGSSQSGSGGSSQSGSGGEGGSAGSSQSGPVDVSGEVSADTTWTADNTYILTDKVFVTNDATLTIEPGTVIRGAGLGSALVVTRGSRLVAQGTADDPIVFTSNITEGLRDPGDWGGVVLLGAASINLQNTDGDPVDGQIEGLEASEGRGAYGGTDDAHDCGTLEYVRIEFAGFVIGGDNELNGLTLGGCGTGTTLDHIQVHRGSDDGVEFFGGTANIKHLVVTNTEDDSVDWDFGWRGKAQFVVVRHDAASDAGFEADNGDPSTEAEPRSEPLIYNATLIGTASSRSPGMVLRRGTWGVIRNSIVTGFAVAAVDVRDAFSVDGTETDPPRLSIENSIFFQNGEGGTEHGETEPLDGSMGDDDAGLDETAWLTLAARNNRFDVDPGLPDAANATAPNWLPAGTSPAATGGAVPTDSFFDATATYVGALPPGGEDWTAGWTDYPEN